MGDKFIEMMEAQGCKFIDMEVVEPESDANKLEKRLGRSVVTKKNFLPKDDKKLLI